MKVKTISLFFVCVSTVFGFCASVQSEDQPAAQANEKFDLALQFKKNDSFSQDCFMNMEASSVLPDGKKASSTVKTKFTVLTEILDVDAEKNARIRSTVTNIECSQLTDDGKVTSFDESNPTAVPQQVHDLFIMKCHPIEYIQESKGKIKDVKGFDELVKKVEGKIVRETMEKAFCQRLEDATVLPPRAISLGDSWEVIKELNGVQVKASYTLTAVKDDSFEFDAALQFFPTDTVHQSLPPNAKVQLTGNGTGKLILDRKSNLVKKSQVDAKVMTTVLTENAPLNLEFTLSTGLTSTTKTG